MARLKHKIIVKYATADVIGSYRWSFKPELAGSIPVRGTRFQRVNWQQTQCGASVAGETL